MMLIANEDKKNSSDWRPIRAFTLNGADCWSPFVSEREREHASDFPSEIERETAYYVRFTLSSSSSIMGAGIFATEKIT